MSKKMIDMLNGSLYKNVLKFTLPVMGAFLLSSLFNVVDMMVVGRLCGSKYVAAVGATGNITALLINFFLGASTGGGIVVAQSYGSGDKKAIMRSVHTALPLAFVTGFIITIIGLLFSRNILEYMGTPSDIIEHSTVYLKIIFGGVIMRMIYAFSAAILRAVGDSKTPLMYLAFGGILNVGFNLFFVLAFNMNVDGVAYGTIISEAVSGLLCMGSLMRRNDSVKFSFGNIRECFSPAMLKRIMVIGIPAGLQTCMFSISNLLLQASINSFGSVVVAGNAAAANIGTFTYVCSNATCTAASNFMGQNYGAKKYDRIKKLPRVCITWMLIGTLMVGIPTRVFGRQLLGIYITDSPEAIRIGILRLSIVTIFYFISGIMDIYTGLLRGIGKSVSSMIISMLFICGVRMLFVLTLFRLPIFHSIKTLYLAYPVTWIMAVTVDFFYYRHTLRKKMEEDDFRKTQADGSDRLHREHLERKAAKDVN